MKNDETASAIMDHEILREKLIEACNWVTDDVTRLQWLQSLINEAMKHAELLSDGDIDAALTCFREVQALHDDLTSLLEGHDEDSACSVTIDGTPCGEWKPGEGRVLCPKHLAQAHRSYPQGWAYYPGDTCPHGTYVGGCGVDHICGACEAGEDG